MPIPLPSFAWRRLQRAVAAWVAYATGLPADSAAGGTPAQVVWVDYDLGPLPHPYVTLQVLTDDSLGFPVVDYGERAIAQRIEVTTTGAGELVRVGLAWAVYSVVSSASVTDTRDDLLDVLQTTLEPVVFVADGLDGILVTPEHVSQIAPAVAVQGCTVTDTSTAIVQSTAESKRYRVRVQIYGAPGDGIGSIDEYVLALRQSLHDPGASGGLVFLGRYGVGVEGVPESAPDVSALSGALRQKRRYFDVSFVCKSVVYRREPVTLDAADPPSIGQI